MNPVSKRQKRNCFSPSLSLSLFSFSFFFLIRSVKKKKLGPKNITFHVGVNFRIERQEIERARCQNDKFFNILGLILESLSNCWHPWHSWGKALFDSGMELCLQWCDFPSDNGPDFPIYMRIEINTVWKCPESELGTPLFIFCFGIFFFLSFFSIKLVKMGLMNIVFHAGVTFSGQKDEKSNKSGVKMTIFSDILGSVFDENYFIFHIHQHGNARATGAI